LITNKKNIDSNKEKICKQYFWLDRLDKQVKRNENTIQEHDAELESLYKKIAELESRLESQEQYSRRTSLRFHNVRVPVDNRGQIIHPVNTDGLVMKICKDKLGIELSINDIGRSHVI
jgi:chromosome segregation ATPase